MMMKWAKERDSLIAQTRAFVNSVIAWKADAGPSVEPVQPVAIDNPFALALREESDPIVTVEQPAEQAAEELIQPLPIAELPAPRAALSVPSAVRAALQENDDRRKPDLPRKQDATPKVDALEAEAAAPLDVRKEIQNRVAAFQAHQHRFAREREAYFNSVLTKARSAVNDQGNGDGRDTPST